jgi:hypothetical protein
MIKGTQSIITDFDYRSQAAPVKEDKKSRSGNVPSILTNC